VPGGGASVILSAAQCATVPVVAAAAALAAAALALAATALAAAAAAAKLPWRRLLPSDADDTDLGE
jgi:hypothetical protein